MQEELLIELINKNFSIADIATTINKSKSSVRHWLNKYNLQTLRASKTIFNLKLCPKCNIEQSINNFYSRRGKQGSAAYCKSCSRIQTSERQISLKQKCVEYKGGKCIVCKYDKYIGALEFHHIDPTIKEFTLAKRKCHPFDDLIRQELDKCVLLCANCHREVHANLIDLNHYTDLSN